MTRWTSADDKAFAETAEDHALAEALLPLIARDLGVPVESLRIDTVTRLELRPHRCRHLRCRLRRLWKRATR